MYQVEIFNISSSVEIVASVLYAHDSLSYITYWTSWIWEFKKFIFFISFLFFCLTIWYRGCERTVGGEVGARSEQVWSLHLHQPISQRLPGIRQSLGWVRTTDVSIETAGFFRMRAFVAAAVVSLIGKSFVPLRMPTQQKPALTHHTRSLFKGLVCGLGA